jgi:hypothetical protein
VSADRDLVLQESTDISNELLMNELSSAGWRASGAQPMKVFQLNAVTADELIRYSDIDVDDMKSNIGVHHHCQCLSVPSCLVSYISAIRSHKAGYRSRL